jgi:hypothetical protein
MGGITLAGGSVFQGKKLSRASITGIPLSLGRMAEEEAESANAYFWEVATVAAS